MSRPYCLEPLEDRRHLSAVVDLRLEGGGKSGIVSNVGQSIDIELWVTITGADATTVNEGVQTLNGAIVSADVGGGAARGTLFSTLVPPFNGAYSSAGQRSDVDGDGDMDIGPGVNNPDARRLFARSTTLTVSGGIVSGTSVSYKLATLRFLVSYLLPGTQTEIRFVPGTPAMAWMEDGPRNGQRKPTIGTPVVLKRSGAPAARLNSAPNVTAAGATTHMFTVTYDDNTAIKTSSIGYGDVRVTGPNGFSQLATKVSVDSTADGLRRTATYRITAPGGTWNTADNGTYTVALQPSQINDTGGALAAARTLGTFQARVPISGTIRGFVYNDKNGSGYPDLAELGPTTAWRVFLDADDDGVYDAGERSFSGAAGTMGYTFVNVPAGTHHVRIQRPAGLRVSNDGGPVFDVTVAENDVTGGIFGLTSNVLISGLMFEDANGNRLFDATESAIGVTDAYIDVDKDGVWDSTEPVAIDNGGSFAFSSLPAGTYVVRVRPNPNWTRTTTPSSYTITLAAGQSASTLRFGFKRTT